MAMNTTTCANAIKEAMMAEMPSLSAAQIAAMGRIATAIATSVAGMVGTAEVVVTTGLASSAGPVTGTIPAGSIV